MASDTKTIRCAIYTRKSSEEGLEQDFNSLDAQREACEAYIKSQKHEGWEAVSHKYDDGGYSGGTLERPALDALLSDIRQKKVDVVVVYKIDRLTRSLFDFSKIVEIFDTGGVSFVSVTQQFNTTTSMGRLTLNVLLSFAQFEREVTGERIRDKIAASKKKGMWMGGCVPFGYRVEKRELVIDEPEAQHVRTVYEKYLELGSVRAVKDAVDALGITSRPTSRTSGRLLGRGHIYRILTNPIYMGKISHKGLLSDGQHQAIIEPKVWLKVQEMLQANNARERDQPNAAVSSPLAGLIFDEQGERLTPSHAVKGGRRYRYYISNVLIREPDNTNGIRLSAPEIEAAVCQIVHGVMRDPQQTVSLIAAPDPSPSGIEAFVGRAKTFIDSIVKKSPYEQLVGLKPALARIVIGTQQITLSLKRSALESVVQGTLGRQSPEERIAVSQAGDVLLAISLPIRVGRRGRETRIILQSGQTRQRSVDQSLVTMVARGYTWRHQIATSEVTTMIDIARREKLTDSYVSRIITLGFLAPDIITAILEGTAPAELTGNRLQALHDLPLDWPSQRQILGFAAAG